FGLAWVAIGWDRLYREGMRDTDLFQLALGLKSPWMVTCSEFAVGNGQLDLYVDFPRGSRFACAECGGEGCAVHDTKDETWRHLDFFPASHAVARSCAASDLSEVRGAQGRYAVGSGGFRVHVVVRGLRVLALAKAMPIAN